jgi:glycosyltransferase involved in cell wall biosynthesis
MVVATIVFVVMTRDRNTGYLNGFFNIGNSRVAKMTDKDAQSEKRIKVFTWHVHGSYLYYLTQANCDFYLPVNSSRANGYGGKASDDPLGDNVHEITVDAIKTMLFDVVLFQSRQHYEVDQYQLFSPEQLKLPKVYLEHDPPRAHPTDTRHFITDPSVLLVHVTDFNRLMWDSPNVRTTVIEHGVVAPPVVWQGTLERGIVVINDLPTRGRRLGLDIFEEVRRKIPLDLVGLGSSPVGGLGPIPHDELPEFMAQYRFFFNPIRYTSLGLAIIEAMMVGLPIIGLATTELVSVITSGVNGYLSLKVEDLTRYMSTLLSSPDTARRLGENARLYALDRFSIDRFADNWQTLFRAVCGGVSD